MEAELPYGFSLPLHYREGNVPMSNPNTPNVLIRLTVDGDFIAISTHCRKHGRRRRFLVASDLLATCSTAPSPHCTTQTAGTPSAPL